jgi:hypothetical protein
MCEGIIDQELAEGYRQKTWWSSRGMSSRWSTKKRREMGFASRKFQFGEAVCRAQNKVWDCAKGCEDGRDVAGGL